MSDGGGEGNRLRRKLMLSTIESMFVISECLIFNLFDSSFLRVAAFRVQQTAKETME